MQTLEIAKKCGFFLLDEVLVMYKNTIGLNIAFLKENTFLWCKGCNV